jgi:hypothetical protein
MTFAAGRCPTGGALACAEATAKEIPTPVVVIRAICFIERSS